MSKVDIPILRKHTEEETSLKHSLLSLLAIPLIILIIPFAIIYGIWRVIRGLWLGLMVRLKWYPQNKYMLFIYSNSPNWKEYIETNILPKIAAKAVVVNWSERSDWSWERKRPLELTIFKHYTRVYKYILKGRRKKWYGREYNPIAITFIPWWRRKIFRFWQPFKDFKHGKEESLKVLEAQLFEILKQVE